MSKLKRFREEIDHFIGQHPQSPLEWEEQRGFAGLTYYDEDPGHVFDVAVERFPDDEPLLTMETSTGDVREYRRWGRFTFMVEGQAAALTVYADPEEGELFLPFKDATNKTETYGAGRYLDEQRPGLVRLGDGRLKVDFNYSYNPYCAYNPHYSCPLPPRENWLGVPVRAGEKRYKDEG